MVQRATPSSSTPWFSLVVASTDAHGIGLKGNLPWRLPTDMRFFQTLTIQGFQPGDETAPKPNAVVMGRKTWESIPQKFRPLKDRLNVVLTSRVDEFKNMAPENVLVFSDFQTALETIQPMVNHTFIIGGSQLYKTALSHPHCGLVFRTRVLTPVDCDVHMPPMEVDFLSISPTALPTLAVRMPEEIQKENEIEFQFTLLARKDALHQIVEGKANSMF